MLLVGTGLERIKKKSKPDTPTTTLQISSCDHLMPHEEESLMQPTLPCKMYKAAVTD